MAYNLIKLFHSDETSFTTNGIGCLQEATSCIVTEERNGSFELALKYPKTGKWFDHIICDRIIQCKSNPFSQPQLFRIYNISKVINGIITVNAHHISYDLSNYPVRPFIATGNTAQSGFNAMSAAIIFPNSTIAAAFPFEFNADSTLRSGTMKLEKPISVKNILGGIDGSFLDIYHGEYEFNNFNVKLWKNRGSDNNVTIRYGKNLTNLNLTEDYTSLYTHVYPFWFAPEADEEEARLVEIDNDGSKLLSVPNATVDYTKIYILDLTEKFPEKPTSAELQDEAEAYISNHVNEFIIPNINFNISFAQLDNSSEYSNLSALYNISLCDTVHIIYEDFGINATAKCIKTTYDVILNKYTSIGLGDPDMNVSDYLVSQNLRDVNNITKIIDNAAALNRLLSHSYGGHAIFKKDSTGNKIEEILIASDDDYEASTTKLWRWDLNGLRFSNTGYNGTYIVGMNMDGEIFATNIEVKDADGNSILVADGENKFVHIGSFNVDEDGLTYTYADPEDPDIVTYTSIYPNGISLAKYERSNYRILTLTNKKISLYHETNGTGIWIDNENSGRPRIIIGESDEITSWYDNSIILGHDIGSLKSYLRFNGVTINAISNSITNSSDEIPTTSLLYSVKNQIPTVVDNHTSTSTTAALSANQGKVLYDLIQSGGTEVIDNLTSTSTTAALSANQGRVLKGLIPTVNDGIITIKMNGTSKGSFSVNTPNPIEVDLGTVITSHQDISGKQDKITSTNKLPYSLISGTPTIPDVSNLVPNTRTINGKALSSNITLAASDISGIPEFPELTLVGEFGSLTNDEVNLAYNEPYLILKWKATSSSEPEVYRYERYNDSDNGVYYFRRNVFTHTTSHIVIYDGTNYWEKT